MSLFERLRNTMKRPVAAEVRTTPVDSGTTSVETRVPEITALDLMAAQRAGAAFLLLDCREFHERRQGCIPGSIHIPMNLIPSQLSALDRNTDIVVICAHGSRSYGVADWLIRQGYKACSLSGGIADWQYRGGALERAQT